MLPELECLNRPAAFGCPQAESVQMVTTEFRSQGFNVLIDHPQIVVNGTKDPSPPKGVSLTGAFLQPLR